MTKDEVKRNAARLIRDENNQRRVLAASSIPNVGAALNPNPVVHAQPLKNPPLNSTAYQVRAEAMEKTVKHSKTYLRALAFFKP
jgi:hypothetical protein